MVETLWLRKLEIFAFRHVHQRAGILRPDQAAIIEEALRLLMGGVRHVEDGCGAFQHCFKVKMCERVLVQAQGQEQWVVLS